MNKLLYGLILIQLFFTSCDPMKDVPKEAVITQNMPDPTPKNIILLIGDGMGLTQISAGTFSNNNTSALERFDHIGLQKTYASDDLITDSAASATAMACGVKTYNAAIGVDNDTMPVKSILSYAQDQGLSCGLIATSTIVHATPACFYSHNKNRRNYDEIAMDLFNANVDLFIGGGKKFFDRREKDDRNLMAELASKGYQVSHYADKEITDITLNTDSKFAYLTADKDPIPVSGGRDYLIPASDMAIDFLSKKGQANGFFLMIEGSQIDWGGHSNDGKYVVSEFLEYNEVIHAAMDFAEKDKETLVIVTADHETGGMAIQPGSEMGSLEYAFTTEKHSATMVPVFAYGPGAASFRGIYDNTEIFEKMKSLLIDNK